MSGTVYTVASGKGGVGKTTTSVNLAVALWQEGNAVALVDADIGMPNLAAVLDITPEATLHDVLAGRASVDEALVEAQGGNLLVLPGDRSLESFANADPRQLRAAVDELAERCDYVIVDTGAGLSYEDVLPLGMAHGVLLVTTPDPAAFGDTQKTMEVADLLGAPIRGLVVTRAVADTDAAAIAGEIGAELLGTIPEDPAVMASTVAGNPLESHAPDSAAAGAYRDLVATLLSGDEEWLEAHPREPAPAPVGDTEPEPDDGGGDDGHEPVEPVTAAAEIAADDEGTTDIGDLLSEPAGDDESGEEPDREPASEPPAGETVEADGTFEDEDTESEDGAEAAEPAATSADVDEVLDDEAADDTDVGDEVGDSVESDEAEGAEEVDEAVEVDESEEDEGVVDEEETEADVERGDDEVEEPEGGVAATEDEEVGDGAEATGDEDMEASEDSEDQEDADEVEPEAEEPGYDDGADWADDQPASDEAEPEEPEKRGGLLGWLGRLF